MILQKHEAARTLHLLTSSSLSSKMSNGACLAFLISLARGNGTVICSCDQTGGRGEKRKGDVLSPFLFCGYRSDRTSFSRLGCRSSTMRSLTSASGGLVLPFS